MFSQLFPTRRGSIMKDFEAGRTYKERPFGVYSCANCQKEAFPIQIHSHVDISCPEVSLKDQQLWVKPPYCVPCMG